MKIEEEEKSKKTPAIKEGVSNAEMLQKMQAQIDELTKQKNSAPTGGSETAEVLRELVTQLKEKPDSEKYGGEDTYTRPEDIDPSDVLSDEEAVTFFSHQVAYIIADDKRNGHNVRTPFGRPIRFVYQSTRTVKHGNEYKLHNISTYTSYSKKEVAWIKEHKFYGTIFFSNHTDALSTDARRASKLARIIVTLQRYDTHKIIKMAKDLGIPGAEDINQLRISIANGQVDREMKAEEESNKIRVKEAIIEKDILKDPVA